MRRQLLLVVAGMLGLAACVKPPAPPPKSVHTIAVFPVCNRTGDHLLISGGSVLEKYVFHSDRVTVPDVLAAEARTVLEREGYTVVSPELVEAASGGTAPTSAAQAAALAAQHDLAGDVLYIDLRQWEPNLTAGPSSIIISLRIDLVDPATGRTLWSADHPTRPVQTPATINFADAYWVAARTVIRQMLEPFAGSRARR